MADPSADLVTTGRFAAPVDADAVRRDWAGRGYDCHLYVDPPGRQWNDFVHQTDELVTVVEGKLRCIVAAQTVQLGVGDELFIPRGAMHSVHNVHRGTTRWLFGYDRSPGAGPD